MTTPFTPLKFEYGTRYADQFREWGLPFEFAVALEERDRELEDFLSTVGGGGPQIIDMGDSAVYTGWSKPFYPLASTTLAQVRGIVTAASNTNETQATVFKNGTESLGVLTIPVDELKSNVLAVNANLGPSDFWQVLVTQAGVGASGLTFYGESG